MLSEYRRSDSMFLPSAEVVYGPISFIQVHGPGWIESVDRRFETGPSPARPPAQNVFNHMNEENPNGAVTQLTFGRITTYVGSPRLVRGARRCAQAMEPYCRRGATGP